MTDIDALRKVAEAATPGPWELDGSDIAAGDYWVAYSADTSVTDAAHIAAFDPPTVLALLDEVAALRATVADNERRGNA